MQGSRGSSVAASLSEYRIDRGSLSSGTLKKELDSVFVISEDILFEHRYHYNRKYRSSYWSYSDLHDWLNYTIFEYIFSEDERKIVKKVNKVNSDDFLMILTREEALDLMSVNERSKDSSWG